MGHERFARDVLVLSEDLGRGALDILVVQVAEEHILAQQVLLAVLFEDELLHHIFRREVFRRRLAEGR
ncbi:MAG: hypothetical protein GC196_10800 [Hyphomonas sp.]|uniref:hypothetical protein n=1 Tax=Hyphomonas sp. TaxID=87 RepID=UPI0037BE53B1|nr:hypothetical protein [Hyphomonas sp.]